MELTLEQKIERLQDAQQIRNLMASFSYLQAAHEHGRVPGLFSNREDAYVDCEGMGMFEGADGIRRFLHDWQWSLDGDGKGSFNEHFLASEVLEVAGDGKTARGLWMAPGCETRKLNSTGKMTALWVWCRYAVDFIKSEEGWKIWHLRIPYDVVCDYHASWVEKDCKTLVNDIAYNSKPKADRPSGFVPALFSMEKTTDLFFTPPGPYDTEDDLTAAGFWMQ